MHTYPLPLMMFSISALLSFVALFSAGAFAAPIDIPPLQGQTLRILTLGDSITNGLKSTTGNGYRGPLFDTLVANRNSVTMLGSLRAGTMADNRTEGHDGAVISEIASFTAAYGDSPNVVLLHAGTNDMNFPVNPDTAPQRLDSLITQLFTTIAPPPNVLVAKIIPANNSDTQARIQTYNAAVEKLVTDRANNGQHALLVDMAAALTVQDLADGLHPNDGGYDKMARVWLDGLAVAGAKGWFGAPPTNGANVTGTAEGLGANGTEGAGNAGGVVPGGVGVGKGNVTTTSDGNSTAGGSGTGLQSSMPTATMDSASAKRSRGPDVGVGMVSASVVIAVSFWG